jgi:hypothetical protein
MHTLFIVSSPLYSKDDFVWSAISTRMQTFANNLANNLVLIHAVFMGEARMQF